MKKILALCLLANVLSGCVVVPAGPAPAPVVAYGEPVYYGHYHPYGGGYYWR